MQQLEEEMLHFLARITEVGQCCLKKTSKMHSPIFAMFDARFFWGLGISPQITSPSGCKNAVRTIFLFFLHSHRSTSVSLKTPYTGSFFSAIQKTVQQLQIQIEIKCTSNFPPGGRRLTLMTCNYQLTAVQFPRRIFPLSSFSISISKFKPKPNHFNSSTS